MKIPIEIIAAVIPVLLTGWWASQRAMWKRIVRIEKNVLVLIVMLRDRGFRIPDKSDTDLFVKANNL